MKIIFFAILFSSCSLFQRNTDWTAYNDDVNFYFTKIREATLARALIGNSFYRETRTFLRYIDEQTNQLQHKWVVIPSEWTKDFIRKSQQAALDQDTSLSGESLSREKFVADINRPLMKYIEQLRSLSHPTTSKEQPRSLFFFWP